MRGLEGVGPPFLKIFAHFLNVLFQLLSRRLFCSILAELGFQMESLLESIFADFANVA